MNTKNKIMVNKITLAVLSVLAVSAYAQPATVIGATQPATVIGAPVASPTSVKAPVAVVAQEPVSVSEGNVYEKSVTPLLREISRKKTLLELKKLDKELSKLDDDGKSKDPSVAGSTGGYVPLPVPYQPSVNGGVQSLGGSDFVSEESQVKVIMTYGSVGDLYAKLAVGDQGGYAVRKGDILPDGRIVLGVHDSYIEVKKPKTDKKNPVVDRIFVTGPVPIKSATSPAPAAKSLPTSSPAATMVISNTK